MLFGGLLAAFVVLVAVTIYNLEPIITYLCESRETIAELDVGQRRTVLITADNCWEISRPIFYEVTDGGKVITPTSYIDGDGGNDSHTYSVVYAEGGALVSVLETTRAPQELVIMQDFKSGESWPRLRDTEVSYDLDVQEKWRGIFERLRRENPLLPIPKYFSDTFEPSSRGISGRMGCPPATPSGSP